MNDVVLTMITGKRPDYLYETLAAIETNDMALLRDSRVVVFHNTGDSETAKILKFKDYIDELITHEGDMLSIGESQRALEKYRQESGRKYCLHIEDDWRLTAGWHDWLYRAKQILDEHKEVKQVRLRSVSEPVSQKNMLTRQRVLWTQYPGYYISENAHYTNNPNLMRVADSPWGKATRERDAQKYFNGHVAQLIPGVFYHIGEYSLKNHGGGKS